MEELQVINHNNVDVIDSREVAEMTGKNHKELLRDIRNYAGIIENSTERNFALSDFFIPNTYMDSTGRTLPCYLLTRKGCDFIASRMTGKKGVQFSARYVCAFDAMRKQTDTAQAEIMLRMENCKLQKAKLLRENSSKTGPWLTIREKQRPEGCITACEAICLAYAAAREDRKPKGNHVCMAFCRHLASKRYGGSASELYNTLMRQPTTDMGYAWIRRAFQAVDIGAAEIQQWFAAE